MTAPTPFHIKCPHCKTSLRVKGWTWGLVAIAAIIGMSLGGLLMYLYDSVEISAIAVLLAAVIVAILCEFAISLLICSRGTLTISAKHTD